MIYSSLLVLCGSLCIGFAQIEPRTPIVSCDDGKLSYCCDCYTVAICPTSNSLIYDKLDILDDASSTSTTTTTTPPAGGCSVDGSLLQSCDSGNVCRQESSYAVCDSSSEVPSCECPPDELAAIPDAYDTQKYIFCIDGSGTIIECDEGEYYHPDSRSCEEGEITVPPPTQVTTPTPVTCSDDVEFIYASCTEYYLCLPGETPVLRECAPGKIFTGDKSTGPCEFYEPFSCEPYVEPGYVSDNTNCSLGHFCDNSTEKGDIINCGEGYSFVNADCVEDPNGDLCTAVEDCGICKDSTTRIKIDCYSYYQCTTGTGDLPFVPVEKSCPTGSYYDEESVSCSSTPPVGCEEKSKKYYSKQNNL